MTLSARGKVIVFNILSLFSIQGLNYILPLITIPYLVRVLGPDKYGVLGFSTAFIAFFNIVIIFGFNLSGAQQISINRNNLQAKSKILSTIIFTQILIALLNSLILILILTTLQKFKEEYEVHLFYFLFHVMTIFQPAWFFQGVEKMKFITLITFISKVIFTGFIFILIKNPSDYILVPKLMLLGSFVGSIITISILKFKFNIVFRVPRFSEVIDQIQNSKYLFLSNAVTSAYTQSITFILGIFYANSIVGYFTAVDKLIKAGQGIFQPIVAGFFPFVTEMIINQKKKVRVLLKKILLFFTSISIFFSLGVFLFSNQIIEIVFGPEFTASKSVLKVMSPNISLVAIASVLATLIFIGFEKSKELSIIYVCSAIISLILAFTLIPIFGEKGAAFTVLGAEASSTILMITYLWVRRKRIFY